LFLDVAQVYYQRSDGTVDREFQVALTCKQEPNKEVGTPQRAYVPSTGARR